MKNFRKLQALLMYWLTVVVGLPAFALPSIPEDGMMPGVVNPAQLEEAIDGHLKEGGIGRSHVLFPILKDFLSHHAKIDEEKKMGKWSTKYHGFATENTAKVKGIVDAAKGADARFLDRWMKHLGERIIGYRIRVDVGALEELLSSMPEGELIPMSDLSVLREHLEKSLGWSQLSASQRVSLGRVLVLINPDLLPAGRYRGEVTKGETRWIIRDGDWNRAYRLDPEALILLPKPSDLQALVGLLEEDEIQEDLVKPQLELHHFNLKAAGREGEDVLLRLEIDGETVLSGTASLPSVHNRQYPVIPLSLNPKDGVTHLMDETFDVPWLRIEDGRVKGVCRILYAWGKSSKVSHAIRLDVPIGGKGTYLRRTTGHKGRGKTIHPEAEVHGVKAPVGTMSPSQSWKTVFGNDGRGMGSGDVPWVDHPEDARLAWVSDLTIPTSRGPNTRGRANPVEPGMPLSGGWASPLLSGGTVYLPYYRPSGADYALGAGPKSDPLESRRWDMMKISADEHLHAFDAATGRTKWILSLKDRGVNWMSFNKGGPGTGAGMNDETIVWIGSTGEVYGADLKTGRLRWMHHIGLRHEMMLGEKRNLLNTRELYGTRNDFQSSVVVVDDVAVVPDHRFTKTDYRYETQNGLKGMDMKTGRILWTLPEVCGSGRFQQGAQIWKTEGKVRVLASDREGTRLIDPRSGKVLAHQPGLVNQHWGLTVGEDLVVGDLITPGGKVIAAYRYQEGQGFKEAWRLPATYENRPGGGVYREGLFYLQVHDPVQMVVCVEAQSGKVLGEAKAPIGGGEHSPFLVGEGAHLLAAKDRTKGLLMFQADPKSFATSTRHWNLTLATGYCGSVVPAVGGGHLFIRTPDRICAYDMRRVDKPHHPRADLWAEQRELHIPKVSQKKPAKKAPAKVVKKSEKKPEKKKSAPKPKKKKPDDLDRILNESDDDIGSDDLLEL